MVSSIEQKYMYEPLLVDIDECSISDVCIEADGCMNTMGGYTCLCPTGLSWNGTSCEGNTTHSSRNQQRAYHWLYTQLYVHADVDECRVGVPNDCHSNADCINTYGGHECYCKTGYKGNGSVVCTGKCMCLKKCKERVQADWDADYCSYIYRYR